MKILYINKYFYLKGGAESVFFKEADLFCSKGHELMFFSMCHKKNAETPYSEYFVSNIDYQNAPLLKRPVYAANILYSFEAKSKLERLLSRERPDVAHAHNIYHQLSPSILHALKKYGIPVVMTLHDLKMVCPSYLMYARGRTCDACKNGRYINCFRQRCVKNSWAQSALSAIEMYLHHNVLKIYGLTDIFIAPSAFLKRKIEEMGFAKEVKHIPNFIDSEAYAPQYAPKAGTIVYAGRLSAEKGLLTLVEAVRNMPVSLRLVGEGPLKAKLQNKIAEENIKNVFLTGYKSGKDLQREISCAMFLILPSECYENNPLSIMEAFALGKPVIGSKLGGIPELVKDGETGLTFEAGNTEDLKLKIDYLLSRPGKIIEMGKNARHLVTSEFNAERHYVRLESLYKSLIR